MLLQNPEGEKLQAASCCCKALFAALLDANTRYKRKVLLMTTATGEAPELLPCRDPLVDDAAFQAAITSLGLVDDEFNQWFLEEGSLRAFVAVYERARPSTPAPEAVEKIAAKTAQEIIENIWDVWYGVNRGHMNAESFAALLTGAKAQIINALLPSLVQDTE